MSEPFLDREFEEYKENRLSDLRKRIAELEQELVQRTVQRDWWINYAFDGTSAIEIPLRVLPPGCERETRRKTRVEILEQEKLRITDLVRYARQHLFDEKLIDDREYAALVADSESGQRVARLEGYDKIKKERDEALAANELDRRNLHSIVSQIDSEITGRLWLIEGRGSYAWNDDRYRQEFGWAAHAIQVKLELLRKITRDLTNSPTKESGVERVRHLETVEAELKVAQDRIKALEQFLEEYTGQTMEEIGQGMTEALETAAELVAEGLDPDDEPIIEQGPNGERNVQ